jgi:LysR family transcriptional regulator for bpeEF and oprC
MDRLDALRVFCTVVDAGGFRRAADRLGISTASVTNHIAALEARFRVKLLHRTTRSMSLTDEGRQCYESAARLLAEVHDLEHLLRRSTTAPSGLLRVDLPGIIGTRIVAPQLPRFLQAYPEVSVQLSANDRLTDMVEDGVDVLVRIGNLSDSRLVAQTLTGTDYICCAAPDYLARHGSPESPADLDKFSCLGFLYPRSRRLRPWYFQRDGDVTALAPRSVFVTDHVDSLISAALGGAGIIQVLSISVQDRIDSGALVPLMSDWSAPGPDVAVLFQQRQLRAAKVKVFVEFLHAAFAAGRPMPAAPG